MLSICAEGQPFLTPQRLEALNTDDRHKIKIPVRARDWGDADRAHTMIRLFCWLRATAQKLKMTPEQSDNIRFPCC